MATFEIKKIGDLGRFCEEWEENTAYSNAYWALHLHKDDGTVEFLLDRDSEEEILDILHQIVSASESAIHLSKLWKENDARLLVIPSKTISD